MSPLKTWLRKLFPDQYTGRRRSPQKKKRQAPVLERLEDRLTPSANTIAFIPHDAAIVTAGQVSGLITFKVTDGSGNAVVGEKVDLSSTSPFSVFFAGPAGTTPITSVVTGANGTGSFVFEDSTAGSPAVAVSDAANTLVSATQVETVNTVAASSTFGEFPGDGVWRYEAATGWQQTTPVNASILVKDGVGDAFAELPGYGIWELPAGGGSYQVLSSTDASALATDARGDLVAELPGYGVYELAANGGWQQLTSANATALSINDQGQITGLFAGTGGGVYQMNAGGGWQKISPVTGSAVAAAANVTVVELPGYGVWEYAASGWQQLSSVNASVLGVDANGDVFGEFPGYGVLEQKAGTTNWKQTTPSDASTFEVDGQGNVVAEFPQYGTYILSPGAGWTQITGADSTALGGMPVAASVANTITFIAPDAATLTSGADSNPITVQVLDQFGNPLAGEQVDLSTSNTATGAFFANASSTTKITDVVTGANGTASFVYTDTNGAGADLTAHDDGNPLVTTTQFETVNAAAAKTISFTSSVQTLTAGVDSATVSVKVVDKNGNPLDGEQVNLSSSDATTGTFLCQRQQHHADHQRPHRRQRHGHLRLRGHPQGHADPDRHGRPGRVGDHDADGDRQREQRRQAGDHQRGANDNGRGEVRDHHGPGRGPVRQRGGQERRHGQPHQRFREGPVLQRGRHSHHHQRNHRRHRLGHFPLRGHDRRHTNHQGGRRHHHDADAGHAAGNDQCVHRIPVGLLQFQPAPTVDGRGSVEPDSRPGRGPVRQRRQRKQRQRQPQHQLQQHR